MTDLEEFKSLRGKMIRIRRHSPNSPYVPDSVNCGVLVKIGDGQVTLKPAWSESLVSMNSGQKPNWDWNGAGIHQHPRRFWIKDILEIEVIRS